MRILLAVLLMWCINSPDAGAATIKGFVKEDGTKEPVIDAVVYIKETSVHCTTGMDGSYAIKDLALGEYTIGVMYTGYAETEQKIIISDVNQVTELHFFLKEANEIAEITITAEQDKGTAQYALDAEKNAASVTNSLSAETIKLLPDITVANVLQRVSGVSIERSNNGDGRYAIVRGMDPRYNYTLVNGIKIPSPDNKNRYVPMDLFPSDLLDRLEVIKALTPSMEGDAIGGAVNMIMKSAPDRPMINANLATGYNQLFFDRGYSSFNRHSIQQKSPGELYGQNYQASTSDFSYSNFSYHTITAPLNAVGGLSLANRFFNKRLGVVIAGSYQNTYRGANSIFFNPNTLPAPGNIATFDDIYVRQYSTQQTRAGVHSKIDYVIGKNHKVSLYNVYLQMNELQTRHTIDTSLSIGRTGTGTGNVYISDRSRFQIQSIYNTTLQGEHRLLNSLKISWSAVYSLSKSHLPDWSEIQTVHTVTKDANGVQHADYERLSNLDRRWQYNSDQDKTGYLNGTWMPLNYGRRIDSLLSHARVSHIEYSVGGLYRNKSRNNFYTDYNLTPKSNGGITPPYDGTATPEDFFFLSAAASQGSPINPNTYKSSEHILAYYGQVKWMMFDKLQILGGARIEQTNQQFETVMPASFPGKSGSISYADMLPSIHLKYMINSKQNLRFSYFKSISRPGFFEIIPYFIQGEYYNESGNPYLKHTQSKNFDIRYELFPKGLDQVLVGVFYKNILNPIETAYVKNGTSSSMLQPQNFGTATNYGFELVVNKFWGHIGISSNYTYTSSSITTDKEYLYRDNNNQIVHTVVSQKRPLQGQSRHIANVSLLYKNPDKGIEMQLAYVYTGRRIVQVSPYKDLDYWQRGMSQLDFSFEKTVKKKFSLYAKITNILNTPLLVEIMQPNTYKTGPYALSDQTRQDRILVQKEYYKQNYLLGIRYKF